MHLTPLDLALRAPYRALPTDASQDAHRRNLVALLGKSRRRVKVVKPYNLVRAYIASQSQQHGRLTYAAALTYYFGQFAAAWLRNNFRNSMPVADFVAQMLEFRDPLRPYQQRIATPEEMRAERLDNLAFKRELREHVEFNRDMQHDRREGLAAALGRRMGHVHPRLFAHRWCVQHDQLPAYKKFRDEAERLFGRDARPLVLSDLSTNRQTLAAQLREIER